FTGADLFGVDFSHSNLSQVNFSGATFRGVVVFHEALLIGLGEAHLSQADLSGAVFSYTTINKCDLSRCVGLDAATHYGSSSIGVDTLILSFEGAGNKLTPQLTTFFRKAEVPKALLTSFQG